ncbi:MAG: Ig-like domain-containing protein, partial [Clostridiales bacterium]|nr:Ig-like domain-containing protein [Clostridiales bacterium]
MLEEESGKRWSDLRREEENSRPKDEPRITSLSLTPERTELKVGQTSVLTATVNMTGGRYRGLVRWRSSDSSVMTVTASGAQMATVTCVGRGGCRITAEAEGCSQSCLCIGLEEQKAPPVPILAAVIVAVVICIGIFAFIFGGSGGSTSDSTENADNTTETDAVATEPDSEPDSEPVVSSLELDGTTAELSEGESLVLTATVAMSEGDYAGTVQWSSS